MLIENLKKILQNIIADQKISTSEKQQLQKIAQELTTDKLRFLRNQAFDIARRHLEEAPDDFRITMGWLEKIVKALDISDSQSMQKPSAYFSPGDSCRNKLLDLMATAKSTIDICVFTISDNQLTQAIIKAAKRGVMVRIITDNHKSEDLGSDVQWLLDEGINLCMDHSAYHMHHKFMIVDQTILANGSFNWTRSASERNEENILVIAEEGLIAEYQREFDQLWQQYNK